MGSHSHSHKSKKKDKKKKKKANKEKRRPPPLPGDDNGDEVDREQQQQPPPSPQPVSPRKAKLTSSEASARKLLGSSSTTTMHDKCAQELMPAPAHLGVHMDQDGHLLSYGASLRDCDWLKYAIEYYGATRPPSEPPEERACFYANAYNIATLAAMLELRAPDDYDGHTSLWRRVRFFALRKRLIGGELKSLYALEHKVLRPLWLSAAINDSRLHMVINCASFSCPYLPRVLLTPANFRHAAEQAARDFINRHGGVVRVPPTPEQPSAAHYRISAIFKWYRKDFEATHGSVRAFIKEHWEGDDASVFDRPDLVFSYQTYDWRANATTTLDEAAIARQCERIDARDKFEL